MPKYDRVTKYDKVPKYDGVPKHDRVPKYITLQSSSTLVYLYCLKSLHRGLSRFFLLLPSDAE